MTATDWAAAVQCPADPSLIAEVALVLERHLGPVTLETDVEADAILFVPLAPVVDDGPTLEEKYGTPPARPAPEQTFRCDTCGRTFSTPQGLGGHQRVHQPDGIPGRGDAAEAAMVDPAADDPPVADYDPTKTCPHCEQTFTTARRRNNHMLTCQEAPA